MDKNSVIGLVLIGLIIIGYSLFTRPNKVELEAMRHRQDSIAAIQTQTDSLKKVAATKQLQAATTAPSVNDSAKAAAATDQLGVFASTATGTEQEYVLENNL